MPLRVHAKYGRKWLQKQSFPLGEGSSGLVTCSKDRTFKDLWLPLTLQPLSYLVPKWSAVPVVDILPVQQLKYFIHRYVFWRHVDPPLVPRQEIVKHSDKPVAPKAEYDPTKRV